MNFIIEKYGNGVENFTLDNKEDKLIRFNTKDLLYALHDATINVSGKKDNKWNLDIEIDDKYDFTDFKSLNEYVDEKDARVSDAVSTILNNFAVISSEYGVLKTYNIKIKFKVNEGEY